MHFSVRQGEKFQRLAAIRVDELETTFPQIREWLVRDAYFSVQGMARPASGRSKLIPALHGSQFTAKTASVINAVHADLDFHRVGLDFWRDVLPAVGALVHRRLLPPPSIIADSGHGCWLFWMLRADDDPDQPVPATWSSRAKHYLLQRAIADRLVELGVDAAAHDLARSTRVPGSVNSKTNRPVRWNISAEGDRLLGFTLNELAEQLGVNLAPVDDPPPPRPKPDLVLRANVNPVFSAAGKRGWRVTWTNLLNDLELLRRLRGGFQIGTRNHAALLHAICWRRLGFNDLDIAARLEVLNRSMTPPLYPSELRDALATARRPGPRGKANRPIGLRYASVATRLRVTREEANLLNHLPPARGRRKAPQTRADQIAERRDIVLDLCREGGSVPTVRAIAARLRDMGLHASLRTIVLDLDAIGPSLAAEGLPRRRWDRSPRHVQMPLTGTLERQN